MARFTNILVTASPGHLEPELLRTAVEFARSHGARLTILDVVEPMAMMRRLTRVRRRTGDVHAELVRDRTRVIRELAVEARVGDGTDIAVAVGRPSLEVVRHVAEHDNDLVIVGSTSVAGSSMPELPKDVMQLLRRCPVPVWVMRSPQPGTSRILALIDPDPDDPVRDGLNGRVIGLATSLARRERGELHVGHAVEWGREVGSNSVHSVSPLEGAGEEVDGAPAPPGGLRGERLGSLLDRHRLHEFDVEVHIVAGHAGEELPKLAEDLHADVIVMGTVARTGISGLIIGNTAETILQSVHCSVLTVKSEGDATPIAPAAEMAA